MKHYPVVVIGGGHAGAEAAHAVARIGVKVALVTLSAEKVGVMSCNPAIGGLGKGHLVREIDALDGLIGRAADQAGIQFRLLNRAKGPAVQGPRVQADRTLYKAAIQSMLREHPLIDILEGEVTGLIVKGDLLAGIELGSGETLSCQAVVLTAGTFLNGKIHIGDSVTEGGRLGDSASVPLAAFLTELLPGRGRLKTGTPPRLDGRTIDWSRLEMQPGDQAPVMMSFLNREPVVRQVACGITHTNTLTHQIVRENLSKSAMYSGHIEGIGPRYCPSLEDKVTRFADKDSHQVFLEPEGLDTDIVYPNGISTSLPADVQEAYVRSIHGLESAVIAQYGYAIEYDFFDPCALSRTLQARALTGLFLAGQINGTTGYEEAAAQGLVAGLNAGLLVTGRSEVVFSRADSYIGVMVDDLVSRGVTEPYRMFTSRAEYRLSLRADNADQRLTPLGLAIGCIGDGRQRHFEAKKAKLDAARALFTENRFSATDVAKVDLSLNRDGVRRTVMEILAFAELGRDQLVQLLPEVSQISDEILDQMRREALYAAFEARQKTQVDALRKDENRGIPADLDYDAIPGLSNELRQKLHRVKPETLAQAGRIEGMTPAALTLLQLRLRQQTAAPQQEARR